MSEIKMLKLRVVGEQAIHCNGCGRAIETALSQLPGVGLVRVDHETQMIEVDGAPGEMDVVAALDRIGYEVQAA